MIVEPHEVALSQKTLIGMGNLDIWRKLFFFSSIAIGECC
jgi:hypothetical protein